MTGGTVQREAGACPHLEGFKPLLPEQNANPYPWLARAREEVPVFFLPEYNAWCVTRYDDVRQILRDTETFSNTAQHKITVPIPEQLAKDLPADYQFPLGANLTTNAVDPPVHTRLRKLIQPAFLPRRIGEREDRIRAIADSLIDDFIADGQVDLVNQFSSPMVVNVFADIMGLPGGDTTTIAAAVDSFFRVTGASGLSEEEAVERWRGLLEYDKLVRKFVADSRANPRYDLTTDLIQAETDDGSSALSDDELIANIAGLIAAGSDTTAILISHATYLLARHPEQRALLQADKSLIPNAIEETLRLLGSVRGLRRFATRDVEVGGVQVAKGEMVYIHVASANRDDTKFEGPDTFDIRRQNAKTHLAFGAFTHVCVGAPLARLEARIALEQLLDRIPDLTVAEDLDVLDYNINLVVPSIRNLRMTWTPV